MENQSNNPQTIIKQYESLEKRLKASFQGMYECLDQHKLLHASEYMQNRLIAI